MNGFLKGIVIILVVVYIVSPVDFCPGPVDDMLVLLLSLAAQKGATIVDDEY